MKKRIKQVSEFILWVALMLLAGILWTSIFIGCSEGDLSKGVWDYLG